jgi:hypothetical protein
VSELDTGGMSLAANHKPKDLAREGLDLDSDAKPEPDSDQGDASDGEDPVEAAEEDTPREETPSV